MRVFAVIYGVGHSCVMTKDALKKIGNEIWMADGSPVSFFGFAYPTRMVVVRLSGEKLWIWSPIALTNGLIREIEALGKVSFLISPNKLHYLFLGEWAAKWPDAIMVASPGLKKKRKDLNFDLELGDDPYPGWAKEIDQVIVHGSFVLDEVLFFHKTSRTLMVCDLIQRFDPKKVHGITALIMKLDGLVGDNGSTPREWRATFLHKNKARTAIKRVIKWNPRQLIIAHGKCAWKNAVVVVKRSLRWIGV